jgi:hypothetical protein
VKKILMILIMILLIPGLCSEEKRKSEFHPWDINHGYCYPEGPVCGPYGYNIGYLGLWQSRMWVHNQMVKYGFQSSTWIYKGVK